MLRSVAISLAFLPLLTSFITASQSTLVEAKAGRALVANATVVMSIAEAAAIANFLVNIFFCPRSSLGSFQTMHSVFQNALRVKRTASRGCWDIGYIAPFMKSFLDAVKESGRDSLSQASGVDRIGIAPANHLGDAQTSVAESISTEGQTRIRTCAAVRAAMRGAS